MKKTVFLFILSFSVSFAQQNTLPFAEIGPYSEDFTAETAVARMIEGLGFRYYWGTDSLRAEDLAYKPSSDSRSTMDLLEHIYGLTEMVIYTFEGKEYPTGTHYNLTFEAFRSGTLMNLKKIHNLLMNGSTISELSVKINYNGQTMIFPFWNAINGPISDAIWHTGQVVSNRRASGNPFNGKAQVFLGKLME